jgi:hypothetical protein
MLLIGYGFILWRVNAIKKDTITESYDLSDSVTLLVFVLWLLYAYIGIASNQALSVKLIENFLACTVLYLWYFLTYRKIKSSVQQETRTIITKNLSIVGLLSINILLMVVLGMLGEANKDTIGDTTAFHYTQWILDCILYLEFIRLISKCVVVPKYYKISWIRTPEGGPRSFQALFVLITTLVIALFLYITENVTVFLRQVIYTRNSAQFVLAEQFQAAIDTFLVIVLFLTIGVALLHWCSGKGTDSNSSAIFVQNLDANEVQMGFFARLFADVSPIFAAILNYFAAYIGVLLCTGYAYHIGDIDWAYVILNITCYLIIPVWALFSMCLTILFIQYRSLLKVWSVTMWGVYILACFFLFLPAAPILFQISATNFTDLGTISLELFEVVMLFQQLHLVTEVKSFINRTNKIVCEAQDQHGKQELTQTESLTIDIFSETM